LNFYDDERMIIEDFQMVSNSEVHFPFRSRGAIEAFKSVRNTRKWANWTYNAGKADPPPDFFSEKYQLMMEVMRVDDHAFVNEKGVLINPVNMRESKLQKEIRDTLKTARPDIDVDKLRIRVNAITNLPSIEDHNYRFYCANFRRAMEKHIQKIPLYRSNHPDKKLIFFVLDESTAYTIVDDLEVAQRGFRPGEPFIAKPAFHFLDNRFINVFRNSDIDYLIWYAPYKVFHGSPAQLPKVCVFDVKKYNYKECVDYPEDFIVSTEA
jgi:hypothetical protein